VEELLEVGIITPSKSSFATPILLARKIDGSYYVYIDYRVLIWITIKNKFPMPHIDDLMDKLHGTKFFFKIELHPSYYQIPIWC
jgi:hypothetical protein